MRQEDLALMDGVSSLTDPEHRVLTGARRPHSYTPQQLFPYHMATELCLCSAADFTADQPRAVTFLPKDAKNMNCAGVNCYKITGIGHCSEFLHVCEIKGCSGAITTLLESWGASEDLKHRRHSVYSLDLLQPCVCWLLVVSSYCRVCLYRPGLKRAILFSSGCTLKLCLYLRKGSQ